jgi:hypothetical protein
VQRVGVPSSTRLFAHMGLAECERAGNVWSGARGWAGGNEIEGCGCWPNGEMLWKNETHEQTNE